MIDLTKEMIDLTKELKYLSFKIKKMEKRQDEIYANRAKDKTSDELWYIDRDLPWLKERKLELEVKLGRLNRVKVLKEYERKTGFCH